MTSSWFKSIDFCGFAKVCFKKFKSFVKQSKYKMHKYKFYDIPSERLRAVALKYSSNSNNALKQIELRQRRK